ncbi:glycosyltransferase [Bradyrhizobium sp.]|uniref:glycosyltransferase family protein n=1 Tax=Bradyrhizobium sp. TaxID=376 RepID=UPI001FDABE65|nr:glycosyltransferase [Bradyrhizobium sp.]
MSGEPTLEAILLAQIEHHATEVFYNLDPVRYPSAFVAKLPGCVKTALCWRAAPSGNADFTAYAAVLGNFPSILDMWRDKGCRAESFFPAHDPVMDEYGHGERPIDVVFVGGYSRHHRLTRLAESAIGRLLPLRQHRRPKAVAKIAQPPVFGRDLYDLLGSAKIVLNGAIDMSGSDRGNMRCFEAMGCGALLVSDAGRYPGGMDSETIVTYAGGSDCLAQIETSLNNWTEIKAKAERGRAAVRDLYSKQQQWALFRSLVSRL